MINQSPVLLLIMAAVLNGTPPALRHRGGDPLGKVGQPEPGRGGHDVYGRRHGAGSRVLL